MAISGSMTIPDTCAALRAAACADPHAARASASRTHDGVTVVLSRECGAWLLTLHSERAIPQDVAAQWAAALGVPWADFWVTRRGRHWMAPWREVSA